MTAATADTAQHSAWRQGLNIAGYVLVLVVNALANALPINGITSGAVSDRFPTFVTPSPRSPTPRSWESTRASTAAGRRRCGVLSRWRRPRSSAR